MIWFRILDGLLIYVAIIAIVWPALSVAGVHGWRFAVAIIGCGWIAGCLADIRAGILRDK